MEKTIQARLQAFDTDIRNCKLVADRCMELFNSGADHWRVIFHIVDKDPLCLAFVEESDIDQVREFLQRICERAVARMHWIQAERANLVEKSREKEADNG